MRKTSVERDRGEAERLQVLEDREEDARAFEVAARFGIPRVREDGRHLSVVADGDELPVLAEKGRGRQSLGQAHLRSLVHDHEVEVLARPVHRAPLRCSLLHESVEPAGRPPDDDERLGQKHLPLFERAQLLATVGQNSPAPFRHRVARVVADLDDFQSRERREEGVLGVGFWVLGCFRTNTQHPTPNTLP